MAHNLVSDITIDGLLDARPWQPTVIGMLHQPRLGPRARTLLGDGYARGMYYWRVLACIQLPAVPERGPLTPAVFQMAMGELARAGYPDGRWNAWPRAPRVLESQTVIPIRLKLTTEHETWADQVRGRIEEPGFWVLDSVFQRWGSTLVIEGGVLDLLIPREEHPSA
jgi:hypothetical protein